MLNIDQLLIETSQSDFSTYRTGAVTAQTSLHKCILVRAFAASMLKVWI